MTAVAGGNFSSPVTVSLRKLFDAYGSGYEPEQGTTITLINAYLALIVIVVIILILSPCTVALLVYFCFKRSRKARYIYLVSQSYYTNQYVYTLNRKLTLSYFLPNFQQVYANYEVG